MYNLYVAQHGSPPAGKKRTHHLGLGWAKKMDTLLGFHAAPKTDTLLGFTHNKKDTLLGISLTNEKLQQKLMKACA